jgi:hypothetical protein
MKTSKDVTQPLRLLLFLKVGCIGHRTVKNGCLKQITESFILSFW